MEPAVGVTIREWCGSGPEDPDEESCPDPGPMAHFRSGTPAMTHPRPAPACRPPRLPRPGFTLAIRPMTAHATTFIRPGQGGPCASRNLAMNHPGHAGVCNSMRYSFSLQQNSANRACASRNFTSVFIPAWTERSLFPIPPLGVTRRSSNKRMKRTAETSKLIFFCPFRRRLS